jgi:hypothetical protein
VPVTLDKSTPNSRANLRIEGEAWETPLGAVDIDGSRVCGVDVSVVVVFGVGVDIGVETAVTGA